jgi:hypothetical protein
MLRGVDRGYRHLDATPSEDFDAGWAGDPNEDNIEMNLDEALPRPGAGLTRKKQHNFLRHFHDFIRKPVGKSWLEQVLRTGQLRPAGPQLRWTWQFYAREGRYSKCRAPGFCQQRILGAAQTG